MNKMRTSRTLSDLTSSSNPTVSEIVALFEGMSVRRHLRDILRVIFSKYDSDPLFVGGRPSRFSSTAEICRKFNGTNTRVLYGAQTIDTAVYETVVRNRFDINPVRSLNSTDYEERSVVSFSNEKSHKLNLLDLTNGKAACYGVPTDVIRSSSHIEGQHFSQFVFKYMPNVDGFIYSSRFTEEECVALSYSKVITKLKAEKPIPLNRDIVKFAMLSKNVKVD